MNADETKGLGEDERSVEMHQKWVCVQEYVRIFIGSQEFKEEVSHYRFTPPYLPLCHHFNYTTETYRLLSQIMPGDSLATP